MIKKFILNLTVGFTLFLYSHSRAQSIFGTVTDKTDNSPIEFTSVSLYSYNDSLFITGVVTDTKGAFSFTSLQPKKYYLTFTFLGYTPVTSPIIQPEKDNACNLGTIQLQPNEKLLKAVTAVGLKENSIHKVDKQIYRADQYLSSKGGTAVDVLKNTPSVSVNSQGEVLLRGSNGFLVLLDGKPIQSDVLTVLNQLPANSIENIEIITTPSAKYDPDGKAGIVNIVTKKGTTDGYSFAINLQGGLPAIHTYNNLHAPLRYGGDISLNFKKKKWDFSSGISYLRNDLSGRRVGDVYTIFENKRTNFPSVGERSFIRYNYVGRATLAYNINKKNIISAGFYKGFRSQERRADIVYDITKVNAISAEPLEQFSYFNSNVAKKNNDVYSGNLDFAHTFENNSSLSFSGLYEHALFKGETKNINYDLSRSYILQSTINPSNNPLDAYRFKVDYSIKIDSGFLESGYQYRFQEQRGRFEYLETQAGADNWVLNPEFSSTTHVINQIHSFYTQYTGKRKKMDYIGGLRYEYATRLFDAAPAFTTRLNLSNLFPSVNLLYKFSDAFRIKAGYSKRVQRSTNNELNPFPEREHSETLEQGDPNILPEFIDLTELGLIHVAKKSTLFLTLYNQQVKNVINRVNSVYNDTILNRIYTNAGKATSWGVEVGASLKPVKWLQLNLGANGYRYAIKGALFNNLVNVNTASWVYSTNSTANILFSPTFSFQAGVNYISEKITAQGKDSRYIIPNLSLRKTFRNNKFSVTVQWQNADLGLLGTNQQRITTYGIDFYTTTNYIQETDLFLINISYSFNQLSKKSKLPVSEFGEKEF